MRRPRPHRRSRVARELWEQVCVHLLSHRVCTTRGKLLTIQLYSEKSLLTASPPQCPRHDARFPLLVQILSQSTGGGLGEAIGLDGV